MNDYPQKYKSLPFEAILSNYRRHRATEFIQNTDIDLWVEVGCGTQPLPNMVTDRSWIVVEPSAEFRHLSNSANSKIYSDIDHVPNTADRCGIIIDSLLHEIQDPRVLLQKYCLTFSNQENVFRINVPNGMSFHRLIALELGIISDVQDVSETGRYLRQPRVYTAESLQSELEGAGLDVISITSSFAKLFTNAQLQEILNQGIVDKNFFDSLSTLDKFIGLNGAELVAVCKKKINV
jgi:hypothetical protein